MAKTVEIHVFTTTRNGQKEARVWPPVQFASRGDTIDFINNTADDIVLNFPDILDPVGGLPANKKQIPPGLAGKHPPKVKMVAPLATQSYQIFSFETGALAIGASDPEIIIE